MSDYIVLVKQVPDVTKITDSAFDPKTGNLMRGKLPSVINELDTQGLALAAKMRGLDDKPGRIVALTMGPPTASEVLRYCLARGADRAVLLTDKALGGADTWATANSLAWAIRKISREVLQNEEDYFIVAGMQSVDGDTAQVPAQVAEALGLPCIAYATEVERNGRWEFTRIVSGGSEVVAPRVGEGGAVVTVAKYEYTLFATAAGTRRAARENLIQWGADDIGATEVGAKGSKTTVIRVFPPEKTSRKCQRIEEVGQFAQVIIDSFKQEQGPTPAKVSGERRYILPSRRGDVFDRSFEGLARDREAMGRLREAVRKLGVGQVGQIDEAVKEKILAEAGGEITRAGLEGMAASWANTRPTYQGEVWVVAEHYAGQVHQASYELVGKARELADSLEVKVGAVLAGEKAAGMAEGLIAAGADRVYIVEHKRLGHFEPGGYRKAVAEVIGKYGPQIVLFAATPQGRVLAPMVSYRLGCGLTADCTGLDIRDNWRTGETAIMMQTRPALGGNVMATICTKNSRCQMATARPGVMKRLAADRRRQGEIIRHEVEITEKDVSLDVRKIEQSTGKVDWGAEVIVSGGRGMQSRENYQQLITKLAEAIGKRLKTKAERGASRGAVEQGFMDRAHQVGQTGTAVGPKIYLAVGISGAIQHMIGVANSQTIMAINNDPAAAILRQCDYYMVANMEEIVPKLVEKMDEGSKEEGK